MLTVAELKARVKALAVEGKDLKRRVRAQEYTVQLGPGCWRTTPAAKLAMEARIVRSRTWATLLAYAFVRGRAARESDRCVDHGAAGGVLTALFDLPWKYVDPGSPVLPGINDRPLRDWLRGHPWNWLLDEDAGVYGRAGTWGDGRRRRALGECLRCAGERA